jgi:hypothetical protein
MDQTWVAYCSAPNKMKQKKRKSKLDNDSKEQKKKKFQETVLFNAQKKIFFY